MSDKIKLPFSMPMINAFHNASATGIIMAENENAQIQILNQCTDLMCDRKFLHGYSSPIVELPEASFRSFKNIERFTMNVKYIYDFHHELIKRMLNDGKYVYFSFVDDYYIPGKSWYKTKHLYHDGIICGYDDELKTYTIVAYDYNWIYRMFDIPQNSFAEALAHSIENGQYGNIDGACVKSDHIELNIPGIVSRLKKFLASDFEHNPTSGEGKVRGIAVYDYIIIYFDMLLRDEIEYEKIDWRVLKAIYDFRKCMLKRIIAIEEALNIETKLSDEYSKVVEETDRLRILYAICTKKRRDTLLTSVRDGILKLKEDETSILRNLIILTEEAITNEKGEEK